MNNAEQLNIDAAQREISRRQAEGEDMTGATICPRTYAISKPESKGKQIARGYIVYVKDGDKPTTETHYAVLPSGKVLYAEGMTMGCANFGPKNPDDWGHASQLPDHAKYCGNYKV